MNAQSLERIDAFLSASIKDLFASHGIALEAGGNHGQGIEVPYAATIGFTSSRLVGVLVLTLSSDLAKRSLPASLRSGGAASDEIIADWTGELSNQALGRLKNRLFSVGIEIALSTPTVFAGKEMRHFFHPSAIYRSVRFEGGGSVLAELQVDCSPDFELDEEAEGGADAAPEGEALFF
jgi:CheY-specific phosphatase CheX